MKRESKKPRVLLVEDEKGIRDLLQDRLQDYDLVPVACQADCYAQLKADEFDLVLLDLRLPVKTPNDMKRTNDVGLDILREIRKRKLTKRGSAMLLPVVVMTAHGSERVSAQVLVELGANDYIPKPFGQGDDLEHKLLRALRGEGALVPASNIVGSVVKVSSHPTDAVLRIEVLRYEGAAYELLRALYDLHVADLHDLLLPEKFRRIKGEQLAKKLDITGKALRGRVSKFRSRVKKEFREQLGRAIDDHDIVENQRDWEGYRLNPRVVQIVRWDQMPPG